MDLSKIQGPKSKVIGRSASSLTIESGAEQNKLKLELQTLSGDMRSKVGIGGSLSGIKWE
jgi:hypothetical protein